MNLFKLLLSLGKTLRETEHSDIKINITKKDGKYTVSRIYSNQNVDNRPDGSVYINNGTLGLCEKTLAESIEPEITRIQERNKHMKERFN